MQSRLLYSNTRFKEAFPRKPLGSVISLLCAEADSCSCHMMRRIDAEADCFTILFTTKGLITLQTQFLQKSIRDELFQCRGIKVRALSNASYSHASTWEIITEVRGPAVPIIRTCSHSEGGQIPMINTTIIPNCDVILRPFISHLNIMILCNIIQEHLHQNITLGLGHAVDPLCVQSECVNRVPASDGICSYNGVSRGEVVTIIFGSASIF